MSWQIFPRVIAAIKARNLHIIYDSFDGWGYITDKTGDRHRVDVEMGYAEALEIIERVERINALKTNNFKQLNRISWSRHTQLQR